MTITDKNMEKLYYTIGETAEILGENVSLIRFWSETFSKYVRPVRNAKGNRLYTESDLDALKQVHYLVRDCGMTLEGAARRMRDEGEAVAKRAKAVESLKDIRAQLVQIRRGL